MIAGILIGIVATLVIEAILVAAFFAVLGSGAR
jgi:hypothetical protein